MATPGNPDEADVPQTPSTPPRSVQCDPVPDPGPRWHGLQVVTTVVCLIGLYPVSQLPYLIVKGQASTRLMAYSVVSLVIGVPVTITQLYLGSTVACGVVGLFSKFTPIFKGIGIAFLIRSLQDVMGYQMVVGHLLFYFWGSLTSPQIWSSCDNKWNTPICGKEITYGDTNLTAEVTSSLLTFNPAVAEREFYSSHVNDTPNDIRLMSLTDVTSLVPSEMTVHKAVTLGVAWFFVLILVMPGVRSFGWAVVCICILLITVMSGLLGYGWYYRPRDPMVLLESLYTAIPETPEYPLALLMESVEATFFSLSLVSGIYPSMGKFSGEGREKRCWLATVSWLLVTAFPHLLIVMLAPFITQLDGMDIETADDVLFILWPKIVSDLKLQPVIASLFYIVFFLLGSTYSGLVVLVLSDALVEGCDPKHVDTCHGVASTAICILGLGVSLLFTTDVGHEWRTLLTGYITHFDFAYIFLLLFFFCIFLARTNSFQKTCDVLSGVWFSIATFILMVTSIVTTFFVDLPSSSDSPNVTQPLIGWLVAAIPHGICLLGGVLSACTLLIGRRPSRRTRGCAALCCGEDPETNSINSVSPEPSPSTAANIVVTVGAGSSAPFVSGFHQTPAPPYSMYEQRPINPAPNGVYTLPKTPEAERGTPQEAW